MSLGKHKYEFTNGTWDKAHLIAAAGAYLLIMLSMDSPERDTSDATTQGGYKPEVMEEHSWARQMERCSKVQERGKSTGIAAFNIAL